jgi:hypothetical protein
MSPESVADEPDRQLALKVQRRHVFMPFAGIFKQSRERVPKLACLRFGEAEADVVQHAAVGGVIDLHGVIFP